MKFLNKFVTATTCLSLALSSSVFASSENSISKDDYSVANGKSLSAIDIIIEPDDEVETGDYITITFTNAEVFDQDVIDGEGESGDVGYKRNGYQYRYNGDNWTKKYGFGEVVDSISNGELPYSIKRMGSDEIKVFLCDLPSKYAGKSAKSTGLGSSSETFRYVIPVVAAADGESGDTIKAKISNNGTTVSSGEVFGSEVKISKSSSSSSSSSSSKSSSSSSSSSSSKSSSSSSSDTSSKTDVEKQMDAYAAQFNATHQNASAQSSTTKASSYNVKVQIDSNIMLVNEKPITLDVAPYIQVASSSTLVPLRAVTTALGGDAENADQSDMVVWDNVKKTVTITYEGKTIVFTVGSDQVIVNGTSKTMQYGVVTEIKDGRTFVPFRALGEALGVTVNWDNATRTASFS